LSETITVIDPTHPLFGQTFRLIQTEDRADRGHCCLIELEWGPHIYVPLAVTDQSEQTLVTYRTRLSVKSIQQLVATFNRLLKDENHVPASQEQNDSASSPSNLEQVNTSSKTTPCQNIESRLSKFGAKATTKGETS
jgi:hypothetical protein